MASRKVMDSNPHHAGCVSSSTFLNNSLKFGFGDVDPNVVSNGCRVWMYQLTITDFETTKVSCSTYFGTSSSGPTRQPRRSRTEHSRGPRGLLPPGEPGTWAEEGHGHAQLRQRRRRQQRRQQARQRPRGREIWRLMTSRWFESRLSFKTSNIEKSSSLLWIIEILLLVAKAGACGSKWSSKRTTLVWGTICPFFLLVP